MSFTFGRTVFDCGPDSMSMRFADQVTFIIQADSVSLDEAQIVREQMLGYRNRVVPILWGDDSTGWDGLYTVDAVQVVPISNYLQTGRMSCSVTVRRVQNPIIETDYMLTFRVAEPTTMPLALTHGHLATGPAFSVFGAAPVTWDDVLSTAAPDGSAALLRRGTPTPDELVRAQVQTAVDPTNLYIGAAMIESAGPDGRWWPVTGAHIPEGLDVRVSNGIVRMSPMVGTGGVFVERWAPASGLWVPVARLGSAFGDGTPAGTYAPRFVIVRNDRAACTLRCFSTLGNNRSFTLDLTAVRGVRVGMLDISLGTVGSTTNIGLIMAEPDGSNMPTTAGVRTLTRTGVNAGGLQPRMFADVDTADATNDRIMYSTVRRARFGVGPSDSGAADEYLTNYQIGDRVLR